MSIVQNVGGGGDDAVSPFLLDTSTLYRDGEVLIHAAKACGATDAVVVISEAEGTTVTVRRGELEKIEQQRSGGAALTVYEGQRSATVAISSLLVANPRSVAEEACRLARLCACDPYSGPAEHDLLETSPRDLGLYHPWQPTIEEATDIALATEQAAFDRSAEIVNSNGAAVVTRHRQFVLMTSRGFAGGYATSYQQLSCGVIARRHGDMQTGHWGEARRRYQDLLAPMDVGRKAATRAHAMLGARSLATRECAVLFEAPVAASLVSALVRAISGRAQYAGHTFLREPIGQRVLSEHLSLYEDPHIPYGIASAPFDDEGVTTQPRSVIQDGILNELFLDCYSARRLNSRSTGNAGGPHNLFLESHRTRPDHDFTHMVATLGTGLLVTSTMGQRLNETTGDYSLGASGFWVESGQIQYPVDRVTIAGNLRCMLSEIVAVGADTLDSARVVTGSILVERMTVAGK
jgi:PmbA protein